ncbi:MAG: SAP domain-containing protein [Gallionella sp.]|nr:SAP domain-containing protein [Gallionella sp.]
MKMEELRNIAKSHGIKPSQFSKTELIKYIQADEGNFDCYATAYNGECDQGNCLWREDCLTTACRREPS